MSLLSVLKQAFQCRYMTEAFTLSFVYDGGSSNRKTTHSDVHKTSIKNFVHISNESLLAVTLTYWYDLIIVYFTVKSFAFSALTLLVGRQERCPACKNRLVGCLCGCLSGARCRLAYGPADATAAHCLLLQ